ncbi:MAG: 3-phosphoshikimate 1-carboxyvinyltransferase [Bacteroidetes bacterium]|nr:3-phosphoshikimate 1-carboxyvinyltransferase [Bacteroidota bacterium]
MLRFAMVTLEPPSIDKVLTGTLTLPGSKSESNRALLFGALVPQPFSIDNCSDCEDSQVFLQWLRRLGIAPQETPDGVLQLQGHIHQVAPGQYEHHLGLAGTALRFITAASCLVPGVHVLTGAPRLLERPVGALVRALTAAGARITYLEKEGYLPVRIEGDPRWQPLYFQVDASQSSQLLSAILLLAPLLPVGCQVKVLGLTSHSYYALTTALLQQWGMHWQADGDLLTLVRKAAIPARHTVESDWSAASYWLGLAAVRPARLQLRCLRPHSLQGDSAQLEIFRHWGMDLTFQEHTLLADSTQCRIAPLDFDFSQMPDLAQTFAVLATWASEPSHFTGLHTLPLKETDRIQALVTELGKLGVRTEATPVSLSIFPQPHMTHTQPVATYHDHRFAMSHALLANRFPRLRIADPGVVAKSYPAFWDHLAQLGYHVIPD